jgi:hypothetical protein
MALQEEYRIIIIEHPTGEVFDAEVPRGRALKEVAADFYQEMNWPTTDRNGRGERAVIELVDPRNPDKTKRLNGDLDIDGNGVPEGATLRIFPEAIAGAVSPKARESALCMDHNELTALSERDPRITFEGNREHAPDRYTVTLRYPSFSELPPGQDIPRIVETHRLEIVLGASYPREAPRITWQTPIFHPNIAPEPPRGVCLGVLGRQYRPGLGLARLVQMLVEMIQWRNFDIEGSLNVAAAKWADDSSHWPQIEAIGGYPFQGPIAELFRLLTQTSGPRTVFRPQSREATAHSDNP